MRVLFKLSGETLAGSVSPHVGIQASDLSLVASEIQSVLALGHELAVIIGGGNFFRGAAKALEGINRTQADHIGMLGTVMNALALQDALQKLGLNSRVMSAIAMDRICEPYIRSRALHHLSRGRVPIFASGTGNPFFTTDTAAALRGAEISADLLLKALPPPSVNPPGGVELIDPSALSLCKENNLPIRVFDLRESGDSQKALANEFGQVLLF